MNAIYFANNTGDFRLVLLLRLRDEVGPDRIVGNIDPGGSGFLSDLILQFRVRLKVKAEPWDDFDMTGADFSDPFDHIANGHASSVHCLI
ncbi:hypothetical protein D3C77_681990 [compost metagenome]